MFNHCSHCSWYQSGREITSVKTKFYWNFFVGNCDFGFYPCCVYPASGFCEQQVGCSPLNPSSSLDFLFVKVSIFTIKRQWECVSVHGITFGFLHFPERAPLRIPTTYLGYASILLCMLLGSLGKFLE